MKATVNKIKWIILILAILTAVYPPIYFMCSEKVEGTVIGADYIDEPKTVVIEYYFDNQSYTITEQDTGYQYDHKMTVGEKTDVYCLRFMPSFADTPGFIWTVYWLTGILGVVFIIFMFTPKIASKIPRDITAKKTE